MYTLKNTTIELHEVCCDEFFPMLRKLGNYITVGEDYLYVDGKPIKYCMNCGEHIPIERTVNIGMDIILASIE